MSVRRSDFRARILMSTALAAGLCAVAEPAALAQDSGEVEKITVTGSRIVRRDLEANSPIVTVESEAFENRASTTVEATLNQLPQFTPGGSESLASGAGSAFPGPALAPGAATLNLRGMGSNRSLILVNGRRAQPVNAQMIVDVNSIPAAAIENVEVITGGAAAVYGADAIAGVVNFKLRDNFEGLEVDAQYGMAEAGDAATSSVSALFGGNFADDRGNAMFAATWSQRAAAYNRNRDFYTRGWQDPGTVASNGNGPMTYATISSINYGVNPDGSTFVLTNAGNPARPYTGPLQNLEEGAGFKLNPPNSAGQQSLGYNDPTSEISVPLTRYSMFGSAHYDIADHVTAFLEGTFTRTQTTAQSQSPPAGNIWAASIPYDPANDDPDSPTFGADPTHFYPVSAGLADLLNARPVQTYCLTNSMVSATARCGAGGTNTVATPNAALVGSAVPNTGPAATWTLNRSLDFVGRLQTKTTSEIYQLTAGLRGDLPIKDWTWEAYGSFGETNVITQEPQGAVSFQRFQQLISGTTGLGTNGPRSAAITGPWAQGWSSGAQFNPSTCESGIPLFNADGSVPQNGGREAVQISPDCVAYMSLELNNVTTLSQDIVELTTQGGLIDYWAGEMRFAAGATYRDADFAFLPDTGNSCQQPTTDVVNQIALPCPTQGGMSVEEAYGELLVPVLADLPAIEKVELELGARTSHYDLSGDVETYKAIGDWTVTDWLRFRGGYQLANRAPNLYELYAPIAGSIQASSDPCVNIANYTRPFGNRAPADPSFTTNPWGSEVNPNILNLQEACEALILRDGGYDYVTLAEDPTAVAQNPADYPDKNGFDITRMSNLRWILGYNPNFPFTVGFQKGNTSLHSEEAETLTLGAVVRSPFQHPLLDRLSLSLDGYHIDLTGTIAAPSGTTVYEQCLSPEFNPRMAAPFGTYTGAEIIEGNPYCAYVQRYPYDENGVKGAPGGGTDRTYIAQYLNMGGTKTSGLDVALNYGFDFADAGLDAVPGALAFNVQANFVDLYKESPFPGAPYRSYLGTAQNMVYEYRLSGSTTYDVGPGSIGLRWRYWPSIKPSPTAAVGTRGAESHTEFDLFGRYALTEQVELRAGIDNVLDEQPEVFGATATNNALSTTVQNYDTIGRRFYIGATLRM